MASSTHILARLIAGNQEMLARFIMVLDPAILRMMMGRIMEAQRAEELAAVAEAEAIIAGAQKEG